MHIEEGERISLALAVVIALAIPGGDEASAEEKGHPDAGAATVALTSDRAVVPMDLVGDRPVVSVSIDGRGPYRFIVDTGAQGSVVSSSLVDELALRMVGDSELHSPAGGPKVPAGLVKIDRLEMGGAIASHVTATSMDFASLFPSPTSPRGILSPAVFMGLLFTFDFPKGEVVVQRGELQGSEEAGVFEYGSDDGLPAIPLTVAGRAVRAHLDSGSPDGITLPKSMAADLPLASPPVEKHRARTVDKELVILGAPLKGEVRLGRSTIVNPDLSFTDLPIANVGFDVLKRYAVTLDVRNHRVRLVEGAITDARAPAPRRYGVRMGASPDGALEVVGTDPGSRAEKAGLLPGDRVLSINGHETKGLGPAELAGLLHEPSVHLVIEREGKRLEIAMRLD